ncbi:Uncharacterized protein TCAP_07341 [Tolypocladium capitatum]|uniref:Protein DSF2 n=1 Tax=Tolypocladium capitatum TaxID=45235 RepID=A0A2K3PZD3_9HYPO|nr:Uncharacterized protein TCAP_07341 [Tolypocladium capitatum]
MGLRELLGKRHELAMGPAQEETVRRLDNGPEFTLIRSDTLSQEVMQPPSGDDHPPSATAASTATGAQPPSTPRRSLDVFRPSRSRSASVSSETSHLSSPPQTNKWRFSQRLHLSRRPEASDKVPQNLPEIVVPADPQDKDGAESQWETRATMLAGQNELARSRPSSPRPPSPVGSGSGSGSGSGIAQMSLDGNPGGGRAPLSSQQTDLDIQEAIRLHEDGHLEKSTVMFARLADPKGVNNPLSQVLYGLALRHGWGCVPDPEGAVRYLSAAASNAASVEQMALQAGLKKGGAAKGELVLAIFELANCFRHGWGIPRDPIAAKQYYETAANLGDTGEFAAEPGGRAGDVEG